MRTCCACAAGSAVRRGLRRAVGRDHRDAAASEEAGEEERVEAARVATCDSESPKERQTAAELTARARTGFYTLDVPTPSNIAGGARPQGQTLSGSRRPWKWARATPAERDPGGASRRSRGRLRRRPGASSASPSMTRIMCATWALSARPAPTTVRFTRAGGYSNTARPARAATRSPTPRAWASFDDGRGVLRVEHRLDARLERHEPRERRRRARPRSRRGARRAALVRRR